MIIFSGYYASPRKTQVSRVALALALGLAASFTFTASAIAADEVAGDQSGQGPADTADQHGEIVVTGARETARIDAGPLGNRSILETPFSVGQADAVQIERIAATTIDAAFNYDASIRSNNSGVASGNTFSIRGLRVDLTNGYKYDGLPFPYWFQDHPIEAVDSIQVLKGAGGFIYGYASPSGVVNFVSKKPTNDLVVNANLSFRSSSIWRAHLDVGGPLSQGSSTAFRFNAVHEEGTLYNGAENKNQFATLWLQGEIGSSLTWSVDGFYQRTWQANQPNTVSIGTAVTHLATVDANDFNLGAKSTTKFNDISQITGKLAYQFNDKWKASLALRHSVLDERFPGNTIQILNNAGDYRSGLLNQNRLFFYNVAQFTVEGGFRTGPAEHVLIAGVDYLDVNFDYDYQPFTANGRPTTSYAFNQTGNIYSNVKPDWGSNPAARAFQRPPDYFRYQEIRQRALFLSDTITLGQAELLLGLRYTRYKETNAEPVVADTAFKENSVTPIVALSYTLAEGIRAYVSRVEAIQRGELAPDNALNFGESLGPIRSVQYEAGLKIGRSRWGLTLAAFRINLPSEYLAAPAAGQTLGRWVRDGERRHQGLEFEGYVRPTDEWSFNVSIAYLDAIQTRSGNAALIGKRVPGTTAFQASGFAEYSPAYLAGLKLFGGVRYSGDAYAQATNSFRFDPVTVGDAGIGYTIAGDGRDIRLQSNVQNLTNVRYWIPGAAGTSLSAGSPRTFSLSVGFSTGGPDGTRRGAGGERLWTGTGWYAGLEAGGVKPSGGTFDVGSLADPALKVRNSVRLRHDTGWEIAGTLGYDLGAFRTEVEVVNKEAGLGSVTLNSVAIPIDSSGRPVGRYGNAGGTTRVFSVLFNGLFDYGADKARPWGVQAGVGAGLARINIDRWTLDESATIDFNRDNQVGFAWQAIAGVKYLLNERLGLSLKYRYFAVPGLTLQTSNANTLSGSFRSQSLLAGATVNF